MRRMSPENKATPENLDRLSITGEVVAVTPEALEYEATPLYSELIEKYGFDDERIFQSGDTTVISFGDASPELNNKLASSVDTGKELTIKRHIEDYRHSLHKEDASRIPYSPVVISRRDEAVVTVFGPGNARKYAPDILVLHADSRRVELLNRGKANIEREISLENGDGILIAPSDAIQKISKEKGPAGIYALVKRGEFTNDFEDSYYVQYSNEEGRSAGMRRILDKKSQVKDVPRAPELSIPTPRDLVENRDAANRERRRNKERIEEARADSALPVEPATTMSNAVVDQPETEMETPDSPKSYTRFDKTEGYLEAREAYDESDERLSEEAARRLKLGMFARRKNEQLEQAEEIYDKTARVFDDIQIEKWRAINPNISEDELAQKLASYHTAKERLQTIRTDRAARGKTGKFGIVSEWHERASTWYAGLSGKQKIAVAAGSVVVGGLLGGAVAFAGATLGTGAAIVGGAGLTGAKLYKTAMQTRAGIYANDVGSETDRIESKGTDGKSKTLEAIRNESNERQKSNRDAGIEKADKVNRRARIATIISAVALGSGIVAKVAEHHTDVTNFLFDRHESAAPGSVEQPETPDVSDNPTPNTPLVEPTPTSPEAIPQPGGFSEAARTVTSGEGWYSTFGEMGITNPSEQANLLQKVGPELTRQGWAYPMADGTYGISRPGQLPDSVLQLIKNSR